jgi:hypothetical protein
MGTVPAICLHVSQIAQLLGYCATYRSYLWQATMPTPGRNQTIRRIQSLQGKLEKSQEQGQAEVTLFLDDEEKGTLRHLLSEMLRLYTSMPSSDLRTQQLTELAALRLLVERAFRQTQAL